MDEAALCRSALVQRLFEGVEDEVGVGRSAYPPADDPACISVDKEGDVDEPGPGRDVEPAPAKAGVKSDRQSMLGAGAWNCRLTQSSGHGAALSLTVVLIGLPWITPWKPSSRVSRSTVQRATSNPSRRSCRRILRTPYT